MKRFFIIYSLLGVGTMIADDSIEVYGCYGSSQHIVVNGRVFDSKEELSHSKEDGYVTNLKNKFSQVFNDEKKNEVLTLMINQARYQIESDDEGYYSFELTTQEDSFLDNQTVKIAMNGGKTVIECQAFIASSKKQIGIISDFDDTLIVSDVLDKLNLINNIFLKNYTQRTLIIETQKSIEKFLKKDEKRAFFVLSGSPKQLQKSIHKFLDYHHFPKRTVITKKLNGDNSDSLLDQLEYKYAKIQKLILLYPNIRWVLFGDSGEKDKEAYIKIARAYPNRVEAIYIRNVENGKIEKVLEAKVKK